MNCMRLLPLDELCRRCAEDPEGAAAREIFRRAREDDNDAAWQAIQQIYRQPVLQWIYELAPELPPQAAERVCYAALTFCRTLAPGSPLLSTRNTPLRHLHICVQIVLRRDAGSAFPSSLGS